LVSGSALGWDGQLTVYGNGEVCFLEFSPNISLFRNVLATDAFFQNRQHRNL
jgi:hypothetical protein